MQKSRAVGFESIFIYISRYWDGWQFSLVGYFTLGNLDALICNHPTSSNKNTQSQIIYRINESKENRKRITFIDSSFFFLCS